MCLYVIPIYYMLFLWASNFFSMFDICMNFDTFQNIYIYICSIACESNKEKQEIEWKL